MNRYAHRIGWMLLAFAVHSLYFPVNQSVQPAVLLKTPLDGLIPLWSVWVVPYVLTWVMWLACSVWVVWKMEPRLYKAAIVALFAAACIGLAWFLAFPTGVERFLLTASDWPTRLLRAVHEADRAANAFPSAHIYITGLIALFWVRWRPRQRVAWIAIFAVVSFSTLFTHQHYVLDVIGGLALAWTAFRLGLAVADRLDRGATATAPLRA